MQQVQGRMAERESAEEEYSLTVRIWAQGESSVTVIRSRMGSYLKRE